MARTITNHGAVKRRGQGWRVRLCVAGARHLFTVHAATKQAAQEWANTKYDDLVKDAKQQLERQADGLPAPITTGVLFNLFEKDYLPGVAPGTRGSYRDVLKVVRPYFAERFPDTTVDRIRKGHVAAYLTWRRGHRLRGTKPVSNRTLEKDRAVLHTIFEFAENHEFREGNPVASTKKPEVTVREPVILTEPEYGLLLAMCDDPMTHLYILAVGEAGFRNESEALWLRWEDVDLDDGFIHVVSGRDGHHTKRRKARHVPMSAPLVDAMREHFARFRNAVYNGQRSPWLFHHRDSSARQTAGERIGSLRRSVRKAANRAEIRKEWRVYDLRHRYVTRLLAKGHNLALVAKAAGHANTRTTQLYTHLVKDDLRVLATA